MTEINIKLLDITSASDGDVLKYVAANGSVEYGAAPGAASINTHTVTVSGGVFYIDSTSTPILSFEPGSTYKFDQSDASNASHPLRFSTVSDGTHNSGSEYTTNVTTSGTPGSSGAYTQIVISYSTPTLYYYCSNHSGMGSSSIVGNPDSAANDYSTYTTVTGLINTVQANVTALPDSAANDYLTYTTLSNLIDTVQDNVVATGNTTNTWVNSNDYSTYTTVTANLYNTYTSLLSDVNLVQGNVTSLTFTVDSADANLYNTYITVTGLIDTVQANVTSLPNSAANDYTTYTTVTGLIDTVQANVTTNATNINTIQSNLTALTTSNLAEGTNLYYTDARVDSYVSGGTLSNIVTTGYLRGPASFTIDPAGHGDDTGTVVIAGNLQVDGVTTTINSTTVNVNDLNIVLGDGSLNGPASDGGGITLDLGTNGSATILYEDSTASWRINKNLNLGGNDIENIGADGYNLPVLDGTNRQVIMTDGSGTLTFEDLDTIHTEATNQTGSTILKGTPVYQTGTSGNAMIVAPADASSPVTMPAVGVLEQDLAAGATGFVIHMGRISGVDTSAFNAGDIIYVAAGGGYTNVAPASEGNLLQNLGRVTKVHATNGGGVIMGAGRTNAVPNLNNGNIFIGNASNQAVTASFATTLTSGLGNNSIDALSDVDTTSAAPTSGDALVWDGSNFVPQAPFSQTDFDTAFAAKDTDDLSEGTTNLYYTDARVNTHLNVSTANANQVLSWSGSDYTWVDQSTGSSSTWSNVSSNVTAAAGDKLFVDTSANPITITLPASPAFGSEIRVIDIKGTSANNKITLDNNGNNIEGITDSLEVNINRAAFGLVFYDTTEGWVFIEK